MVILKERFRKVRQGLRRFRVVWEKVNIDKYWKRYRTK